MESAVAVPQATFGGQYPHETIFAMAAAYLFHLTQNHPFVDGNKRVGANSAITFLLMNGIEPTITEDELVDLVLRVAQGEAEKPEIAALFKEKSRPYKPEADSSGAGPV